MKKTAEHALVHRAKAGDEEAIEALIRAHQDALYAFMLRMSGRPETAEDIVQESLLRVLKNIRRFDDRFRFSTWLFTIAKRLYMNSIQKHGPKYDTEAIGVCASVEPGPGGTNARREAMANARRAIDVALAALPPHQREIVLLYHQQCWPVARIAEHLDMPLGTVKSHLHRGRIRMKRTIIDHRMQRPVEEIWS